MHIYLALEVLLDHVSSFHSIPKDIAARLCGRLGNSCAVNHNRVWTASANPQVRFAQYFALCALQRRPRIAGSQGGRGRMLAADARRARELKRKEDGEAHEPLDEADACRAAAGLKQVSCAE